MILNILEGNVSNKELLNSQGTVNIFNCIISKRGILYVLGLGCSLNCSNFIINIHLQLRHAAFVNDL